MHKRSIFSPPDLLTSCSLLVALLAAIGLATVGIVRGTYAAGGSDSSCYVLMAEAFASGRLQPTSSLVSQVPWPDAARTFTPGGFVPSGRDPAGSAPICAPGFSLLLAPVLAAGGQTALFAVTPVAGALLVWMTFLAGRALGGPVAGAAAAVLIATSPAVLFQVVQPMNDVTTAALWMAVFVALLWQRWARAGACCGLALLVRPNLLPLAAVAGTFVLLTDRDRPRSPIPGLGAFALAALPGALAVLWLNGLLYGSPFRSGYGQLGYMFGVSALPTNAPRYFRWMIETHTPFPLLAFAAPFVVSRETRPAIMLAIALIVITVFLYCIYTPFDDWTYLRFLLPAIALMLVLASVAMATVLQKVGRYRSALVMTATTVALAVFGVRTADARLAFTMQALEQRYRSAGIVVRDRLPAGAVVLSVWDSGAVRFHGRKEALTWEGLDPAWLDRALDWLVRHGRTPYILVESWEETGFRRRFGNQSDAGKLDWPPKYEIDRVVRIYDPDDRPRYHRGERVTTEYVWPVRR
jgi:hypothetical protein